jgi:hypothetical protein
MYPLVLSLHSWLRWVVILAGLIALMRAIAGWTGERSWTAGDNRVGAIFVGTLDLQLLLGLLLYLWLSPITWTALADLGGAMRTPALRFWAVEHVFGMLVAIAVAHVGRVRVRRAASDTRRHRITALSVGFALLVIAITIPWPFMPYARPLLRW